MYEEELLDEIKRYIESHLHEEISLEKLSNTICYSHEYTSRFFKRMTGTNLFEYIRKCRLFRAARELRNKGGKILDIALAYGFNSHEGFSRAFSSQFGVTPVKFRNSKREITMFMPSNLNVALMGRKEKILEELIIFTQIIERPHRKLLLFPGKEARHYWEYCEEVGCDVWGKLLEIKEALYEPTGMWLPENFRAAGTSEYVQGVEVPADYKGIVPEKMKILDLPACQYLIFQSNPFKDDDEIMAEIIGKMQKSIKNYNPEVYGFKWAPEAGPRFQMEPIPSRGYIEGYPIKAV